MWCDRALKTNNFILVLTKTLRKQFNTLSVFSGIEYQIIVK